MIRDQRLDILMIQETKMKKESLERIKFSNIMSGEALNSKGASRGLLTLFNNKHFRVESEYNDGNILSIEFIIYTLMKAGFCWIYMLLTINEKEKIIGQK